MDIISFNEAATANGRIEKFIENPDSNSGVLTQPKVIEAGETVTIKSGRQAILADTVVNGDLVIEAGGEVFVPAGAGFGDLDQRIDTKLDKDFSSLSDKPTPDDTDNLALQETGGLLKKLSFANLKLWILSLFNPTLTTNATLTGINNKIVMNGIVTSLGLEIGDVIQFTSVANANNQKMRTVESIINNNEIIVNYEHCGARGNGSLKLTNETLTNATIKRIAKWYNAPLGLGQAWVTIASGRAVNVNYTNTTGRAITIWASAEQLAANTTGSFIITVDGVISQGPMSYGGNVKFANSGVIPQGSIYSIAFAGGGSYNNIIWSELR